MMNQINRQANYDQIAHTYDHRYDRNSYTGVEQAPRGFMGSQSGLQILEVGCGTGHWLEFLQAPNAHLTGLDFSAGMLVQAQMQSIINVNNIFEMNGHYR